VDKTKDWVKVLKQDLENITSPTTAKGTFDGKRKSCVSTTSIEIEILTSEVGFADSPQSYIVGANVKGITEEWIYHASDKTTFTHRASVSFRQVLPPAMHMNAYSILDRISGDLFYPLNIKSGAHAMV